MGYEYNKLWQRTQLALKHIWTHHGGHAFDFVLKADDDSYIFVDHLRSLLDRFRPDERLYLGHALRLEGGGTWMSGGAGYVVSGGAFRAIGENIFNQTSEKWRELLEVRFHCNKCEIKF